MVSGAAAVAMRRVALLPQRAAAVAAAVPSGFRSAAAPAAGVLAASPLPSSSARAATTPPTARPFSSGPGARSPTTTRAPASTRPTASAQHLPPVPRQWLGLGPPRWASPVGALRHLSMTSPRSQPKDGGKEAALGEKETPAVREPAEEAVDQHLEDHGFQRSEKAAKAAHINMSARLSKEGVGARGKPGLSEVWRLVKIARPELRWLAAAFVLLLVSSAVTMSIPFSVGRIMDLSTKGPIDEVQIFGLTLRQFFFALAAVLTVGAGANFGRIILLRIVGERVVSRLRAQLYRRTYVQDAEFFDANRVGDLISRLSSDTVVVGKSITQNMSDGLRALVSGSAGFVMMAWMSPMLTSIIFVMVPPMAIGAVLYGRSIRHLSRQMQKNLGTLTKIAEERLGNVKTSQAFAGEVQEINRYSKQVRKVFALGKREAFISGTFFATTSWGGNMTILAMLIVGGNLVRSGTMSLGDLTSFMMYTAFAGSSLFGLSGFYSELMKGVGAASRLFELQDRKPSIHQTVGTKVTSAQGVIKFSNVTFAYPTRPAVTIFNGLDFEIPSGSNVCIVGPSGGGKSTVASLLLRFYTPTSGTITINGIDISKMNVKSLRRRIGMVAQEPVLFSGTIAENISYGNPSASRTDIIAAAKKANCGFISDFPEGLETQVGARGAQLSGGQKQRIAIARALLKDPDILLLDEATSALDAESETLVNSALAALLQGRSTTISIAHRLSTIKRSDTVIVLSSGGTVAEVGSYTALSADKNSAFSKLMEWQMSGGEVTAEHRPPSAQGRILEPEQIREELEEEEEYEEEEEEEEREGGKEREDDARR